MRDRCELGREWAGRGTPGQEVGGHGFDDADPGNGRSDHHCGGRVPGPQARVVPAGAGPVRAARAGPHRPGRRPRAGRGHRGPRPEEAAEVERARRRPRVRLLRVPDPDPHGHRGVRRAVLRRLRVPDHRHVAGRALPRGPVRRPRTRRDPRLRDHPLPQQPRQGGSLVAVLRLAHLGRLAGAVHDLHGRGDAAVLPRREDQRRRPRGHGRGVRLPRGGCRTRAARGDCQRMAADARPLGPRRGHPGLPADRAAQQAPAHLRRPDQRVLLAPSRWPRAPAGDVLGHREDRLRGPRRRRRLRPWPDRGLHLEGPARHGDLHRVRSLPEPVPGVEHREAAEPQAHDHGPA